MKVAPISRNSEEWQFNPSNVCDCRKRSKVPLWYRPVTLHTVPEAIFRVLLGVGWAVSLGLAVGVLVALYMGRLPFGV